MTWELLHADCRAVMANMGDETVDAVVCDPPYHLTSIVKRFGPGQAAQQHGRDGAHARLSRGFMGKTWDGGDIAFDPGLWAEVLRVLKPGGHLIAFSGTRTYHRMACAIEDAGFEIRDMLEWLYGSGFPKGGLDDEGRGGALKPAHEPMCLARKSFKGSAAGCVETHGTGLLNIDACRIAGAKPDTTRGAGGQHAAFSPIDGQGRILDDGRGRFPANVCHDGSPEVLAGFPDAPGQLADASDSDTPQNSQFIYGSLRRARGAEASANSDNLGAVGFKMKPGARRLDSGSAARFFYCAKASKRDRDEGCEHLARAADERGNTHPTVKPTDLMRWLVRLACPPGGLVFDPFTGSGSTGKAALLEGRRFLGAEMTDEYIPIARARIEFAARLTAGSN